MEIIDLFLSVIENPRNQKVYKDLKKYYESKDMKNISDAFEDLLKRKFDALSDTPSDEEQLDNS